jgi:hyaluronate lyase
MKRLLHWSACLALLLQCACASADNFDQIRANWNGILVGAANDMSDADIAASVNYTASQASGYLSTMNLQAGRTYLWNDGSFADFTNSATITNNYTRLKILASAWAQPGGSLQGDASLLQAVVGGLDWMYANHYNEATTAFGNWWDWQIGTPQLLGKAALLLYPQLTPAQIANYTNAMNHFVPNPTNQGRGPVMTGANLADQDQVVLLSGVLAKDGTKIALARDDLSGVFPYVTSGDGFYVDGSFIQHGNVAYTGSYGAVLLGDVALMLNLLNNSAWPITDPNQANVWNWVSQSYAPLLYNGAMMDMVMGRGISRCTSWDHGNGRGVIVSLLRLSYGAPAAQQSYLQSLVKGQVTRDASFANYTNACPGITGSGLTVNYNGYYSGGLPPYDIANLKSIVANGAVAAAAPQAASYNFASMARVAHLRPGFAFGLSLFSPKVTAYEMGNGENLKAWYTGTGMTYLYNADQTQFDDDYWATINPLRLPGVTTDGATKTPAAWTLYANPNTWVGGSVLNGLYTSAGMQFSMSNDTGSTLAGKKSWFLFDDKMVALGAGINSTSAGAVETIVDNRRIDAAGDNALVVNGSAQPTALGTTSTLSNVSWAWLDGNAAGSGVGYYFPTPVSVNTLRENRTGTWNAINTGGQTSPQSTNNFVSLALAHGTQPSSASYAYAVLPNQTSSSMSGYAASPDIAILANTTSVQAVLDKSINVVGANFWNNSAATVNDANGFAYLSSAQQASVTTRENGGELDVAVADPTQANTGSIAITINRTASSVISSDPQVSVTQLSPTIQLSVNVNGSVGKSYSVKFNLNAANSLTLGTVADAYVRDGSYANTNYGSAIDMPIKNDAVGYARKAFLRFSLAGVGLPITGARVVLTPSSEGQSGFANQAFLVSNDTWGESTITWNNAPAIGTTLLGNWNVPGVGTPVSFDVTAQAQSALAGDKLLSLAVVSPANVGSNGWVNYASKENVNAAYRPVLVVTTSN